MARRGFFAELNRQIQISAREKARAQREAERAHAAAVRRSEQARKQEEKARKAFARATEAERKSMEKEAAAAHVASMQAEVEERTLHLEDAYAEIDSLLQATLDVDDYVDLDSLRVEAQHPPFDRPRLERPIPAPGPPVVPPKPIARIPKAPTGVQALWGKKKHALLVQKAEAAHQAAIREWQDLTKRVCPILS